MQALNTTMVMSTKYFISFQNNFLTRYLGYLKNILYCWLKHFESANRVPEIESTHTYFQQHAQQIRHRVTSLALWTPPSSLCSRIIRLCYLAFPRFLCLHVATSGYSVSSTLRFFQAFFSSSVLMLEKTLAKYFLLFLKF